MVEAVDFLGALAHVIHGEEQIFACDPVVPCHQIGELTNLARGGPSPGVECDDVHASSPFSRRKSRILSFALYTLFRGAPARSTSRAALSRSAP